MEQLIQIYQKRQASFAATATALQKKYNYYSIVRLVTFFAAIGLGIYLYAEFWRIAIVYTILFFIGFYRFMLWHMKIKEAEIAMSYNFLAFTEDAIRHIDAWKSELENNSITDFSGLSKLRSLRTIRVGNNKIDFDAVMYLKNNLPECTVGK